MSRLTKKKLLKIPFRHQVFEILNFYIWTSKVGADHMRLVFEICVILTKFFNVLLAVLWTDAKLLHI